MTIDNAKKKLLGKRYTYERKTPRVEYDTVKDTFIISRVEYNEKSRAFHLYRQADSENFDAIIFEYELERLLKEPDDYRRTTDLVAEWCTHTALSEDKHDGIPEADEIVGRKLRYSVKLEWEVEPYVSCIVKVGSVEHSMLRTCMLLHLEREEGEPYLASLSSSEFATLMAEGIIMLKRRYGYVTLGLVESEEEQV